MMEIYNATEQDIWVEIGMKNNEEPTVTLQIKAGESVSDLPDEDFIQIGSSK